jgi:hypothetical protein
MIKHKIQSKNGTTKEVNLTPQKAIRQHCLQCVGWVPSEVRRCTGKLCPLYPYRLGSNSERNGIGNNFIKKG